MFADPEGRYIPRRKKTALEILEDKDISRAFSQEMEIFKRKTLEDIHRSIDTILEQKMKELEAEVRKILRG